MEHVRPECRPLVQTRPGHPFVIHHPISWAAKRVDHVIKAHILAIFKSVSVALLFGLTFTRIWSSSSLKLCLCSPFLVKACQKGLAPASGPADAHEPAARGR